MTSARAKLVVAEAVPSRPAIRIRDLHKNFGGLAAIDGVSVEIAHASSL